MVRIYFELSLSLQIVTLDETIEGMCQPRWTSWSCLWPGNFKAACDRKLARYKRLALDIKENGYSEANMPLEVGCRGVIDKRNALTLETICNLVGIKAQQRLKGALARIALLGSYQIYFARKSPEWSGGELI